MINTKCVLTTVDSSYNVTNTFYRNIRDVYHDIMDLNSKVGTIEYDYFTIEVNVIHEDELELLYKNTYRNGVEVDEFWQYI